MKLRIMETTYGDNTFWVEYRLNNKYFGYEILEKSDLDKIPNTITEKELIQLFQQENYTDEAIKNMMNDKNLVQKESHLESVKKYLEIEYDKPEILAKLSSKPHVSVCGENLEYLIEECRQSDNEMWYIDKDMFKSKEEKDEFINEISSFVSKLNLENYVVFNIDNYNVITIFGGILTKFLF